ncbi:hypothetical protein FLWE109334_09680 [Flavobacterium weaverense]|uniref:Uncharacterized protein n=1 Tax=Flavobacterium weaverense TaxID=271156 RepID=A0A3L9ZRX2_9FLAO|nr:hypothetical protein BC961_2490 [Flavobacterium weaverense]
MNQLQYKQNNRSNSSKTTSVFLYLGTFFVATLTISIAVLIVLIVANPTYFF